MFNNTRRIFMRNYDSPCIFVVVVYFVIICGWSFLKVFNEPRYWRQRNIIEKVDELSRIMSLERINENPEFERFSRSLQLLSNPGYVIFYDSSNLDITYNHICNLKSMPNSLSRLAAVSFDKKAYEEFDEKYPEIPNVLIDLDDIKNSMPENLENRKYIFYQIILLVRTRICAALASRGIDFWAMQQDTLWIDNFSSMDLEHRYPNALMLFDTVGNDLIPEYDRMRGWICGSTFFVRGNPTTFQFFSQIDTMMRTMQSPDSSIMTYLCGHRQYKCQRLPRWIISSSNYFLGPRANVPVLVQVDTDSRELSKREVFQNSKFIFRSSNGTCDEKSVRKLRSAVQEALPNLIRTNIDYTEKIYNVWKYQLKSIFNKDPYNNKLFLTVHYGLI
ncbi:unnamed protein product [Caenorhabditis angaria]|uniref:Nucleotide-diphospho-sugar transferase domain-containing protein n=1 Tax=Caenorhabditis angaria TaxID=860376 RepID=A0A9P1I384_9PELO|nr:unnamed protein product [Caenorhabditis angaria]